MQVANVDGLAEPFAIGPALAAELAVPVAVGNDVNVAVEAERRFGAGRGFRSFLGVFWGTGIGGGLVVDGRLLHGRGSAGEIGHVCARPDGAQVQLRPSRLRRGLRRPRRARGGAPARARARRSSSRSSASAGARTRQRRLAPRARGGRRGRACAARRGGSGAWRGDQLAVTLLDVEAVVVGGGLGERLGSAWLSRIEEAARPHTFFRNPPEYRLAALGDLGGAIGASLLVK